VSFRFTKLKRSIRVRLLPNTEPHDREATPSKIDLFHRASLPEKRALDIILSNAVAPSTPQRAC